MSPLNPNVPPYLVLSPSLHVTFQSLRNQMNAVDDDGVEAGLGLCL